MNNYVNAPEPGYGHDDALTAGQAFARAQRALERAETAVDALAAEDTGGDLILEIAAERSYIGNAWTALGVALDAQRRAGR